MIVSTLLVAAAAICNAAMDRMEGWAFHQSIFKWWKPSFWNHEVAAASKNKTIGGWKFDGWHVAKSLMIIFFSLAVVFYKPWLGIFDVLVLGAAWNAFHPIFYGKILKR